MTIMKKVILMKIMMIIMRIIFFPHLFAAGSRSWLLYWAVSRQRQRNDCCTDQSPGTEVTVLLVSLQAREWEVAKSKPCSLRGGWGSAGGRGLSWHVGEEFVTWWQEAILVVVGWCPRITSLRQRRWRWHEQGGWAIWRRGHPWRLGARVQGSGEFWHGRVGGGTLRLLIIAMITIIIIIIFKQLNMYMIYWGILLLNCDHAEPFQLLVEISMQWSGIHFLEMIWICLVLAGLGPEMNEAGCLWGGCWNTVCLSKLVWIEMFDTRTVDLPTFHGWNAGANGLYFELCATSIGQGEIWFCYADWSWSSVCPLYNEDSIS